MIEVRFGNTLAGILGPHEHLIKGNNCEAGHSWGPIWKARCSSLITATLLLLLWAHICCFCLIRWKPWESGGSCQVLCTYMCKPFPPYPLSAPQQLWLEGWESALREFFLSTVLKASLCLPGVGLLILGEVRACFHIRGRSNTVFSSWQGIHHWGARAESLFFFQRSRLIWLHF